MSEAIYEAKVGREETHPSVGTFIGDGSQSVDLDDDLVGNDIEVSGARDRREWNGCKHRTCAKERVDE